MNAPHPARILVVDDERLVAREIAENLQELGYEVPGTAATADEALEIARHARPDLVLLDIRIRGPRDGVDTAVVLRSRFGVPVIYITGCTDNATLKRAKDTEPYGYLIKPIKPIELRSAVEIALHKATSDRRAREQGAWLSTTLRSIADAVVATDVEGRITFMNPAAESVTSCTLAEVRGQPYDRVFTLIDENTKAPVACPLGLALRERTSVQLGPGIALRRPGGDELAVEDSAAPLVDHSGKVVGAVMVFRDVSKERRLLVQAELNDRLAALGTLAAGVAHEVNNPLSFIIGNQQYALQELTALHSRLSEVPLGERELLEGKVEEISAALADAQAGADRVRRIVSELRKLSRPGVEKRERIDLCKVIEAALAVTLTEVSARAHIVREYGQCPPALADETRLTQVFVNLLINAAHAIAPGNPEQNQVRVLTGTDEFGHAYAEVRDTGSGIPKSLIPRVFEPFFTTRALETGTGLGLSVSHGIIASFGGNIQVESRIGVGSSFRVTLPPVDRPRTMPPPSRHPISVRPQGRQRLLIIDDERILLDSLTRALEDGYAVTTASGGREALALLEGGQNYDLVICDLMMPHMTGMEFYRELETLYPQQAARTVFMTGGAFTQKAQSFLGSKARRVLEKPFTNTELLGFIGQSLQRVSR